MSLLAPLFLVGLAALAIPILVHLIQRERKQVVVFPSLMFLQKIPYQSVRRQRIRHWLLLLLRCAALVLLVLAFARPFFTWAALAADSSSGAREVVILVDRSYSMAYGDHWDRARAAARAAVGALGPEDRATLIFFSRGAQAGARSTLDRTTLLASINAARVDSDITRYGPALKLAQSILEDSELPRGEAILISDFQKAGWEGAEGVQLPEGSILAPRPVSDPETFNVTVSQVSFQRDYFSGLERLSVSARLANRGAAAVEDVQVALEIDGREIETQSVSLEPNGSAGVTFAPFTLAEPRTPGTVRAEADALPQDNALHFVVSPGQAVSVLVVEGASAAFYLTRALAIGSAPAFRPEVKTVQQVTPADFDGRAVVVLNDVRPPTGGAGRRLATFVENGGGLFVVLGEQSSWPAEGLDLLPGSFGRPVNLAGDRGGTLGFVDYSHPVFEIFSAPRSGDLSAARYFRYRPLDIEAESERVLARFNDGAVALAERRVGRGRVLVLTSTLDSFWNNLALRPVFLPFVHGATKYLAGYVAPTPWFTVGQVVDLPRLYAASGEPLGPEAADTDRVALAPSGQRIPLTVGDRAGFLGLAEAGFYEIRTAGAQEARPLMVAANPDLQESDLSTLDPEELAAAVTGRAGGGESGVEDAELSPADLERRQTLWWYILVGAFALLAAETAVSNRLSRVEQ